MLLEEGPHPGALVHSGQPFREQGIHFESGRLQTIGKLSWGVLSDMRRVGIGESRITGKHLRISPAVESHGHTRKARDIRGGQQQYPSISQDAVAFEQKMHRIGNEVLDKFATEHEVECPVTVRESMSFHIEQIHVADEVFLAANRE